MRIRVFELSWCQTASVSLRFLCRHTGLLQVLVAHFVVLRNCVAYISLMKQQFVVTRCYKILQNAEKT
jgi:hypothetical protein